MAARVGLTGGIGSGKTTVAGFFSRLGIQVIDADSIAHCLSAPGTAEFDLIVENFGSGIVSREGHLERKQLGRIVFNCPEKRKLLESILHPPIRREMYARAQQDEQRYCILDIPLLVENSQYREMDRVVVVTCNRDTRIQRLQDQRKLSRDKIEQIMQNQASEQQRLAVADDIVDNNGTRDQIERQVTQLHQTYLDLFKGSR